jgi:DNA-binding transcriptional LysR family regulator
MFSANCYILSGNAIAPSRSKVTASHSTQNRLMEIKRGDLPLLVALDALLLEQSVTRAATRLGVTQSALSQQLKRLREMFGDELLVPGRQGMSPTPFALDMQEPLRVALQQLEEVVSERQAFDPATTGATFALAGTDYGQLVLSEEIWRRVHNRAPYCRLGWEHLNPKLIVDQLEAGSVDLLITADKGVSESLKAMTLLEEHFVFIQRKGHQRGEHAPTLDEFCDLDQAFMSVEGGTYSGDADDELRKLGRRRRVVMSLPSFVQTALTVMNTDLVAVVPAMLAYRFATRLERYELPFELPHFRLLMAWHQRQQRNPAHMWIRQEVLAAAKLCEFE